MKIDLSGSVAVITGATGQLGRVMVRTLASCGADVAVHYYTNRTKAEELVAEVRSLGRSGLAVSGDVSKLPEVERIRSEIHSGLGVPDIVVNNAVVQYKPWTTVLEQPTEDYESQFESCVLQNVNMAKVFVPAMQEQGYGRFIGINTECAMQCAEHQSAYVSGKRGMDGVLRVLAKEIGQYGITVNQVAPGWTISENDRMTHTEKQDTDVRIPLRRRGTDQEVANVVAFLASPLSSYVSGAYIPVCGGNVMPTI